MVYNKSLGSVEGTLRYTSGETFFVDTFGWNDHVTVTFPDALAAQFKENIDQKVHIRGLLFRNKTTDQPMKIHAEKIEQVKGRVVSIQELIPPHS